MSHVISTEIDVDASPDQVWAVLVDLPRYGEWSNFSRAEGVARVGSRLTMRMPGFTFRPTVTVVEPGNRLQWSGTLLTERLFLGRHTFVLTENPDGTTHVTNHEEFSGAAATVLGRFTKQGGSNGYTAFNTGLKQQAESRGGGTHRS